MYGTDWTETVEPDEEARFARHVTTLRAVQVSRDAQYGERARTLHRQAHAGVEAVLEVRSDLAAVLPEALHVGPLQPGARFAAYVRFSNGAFGRSQKDDPDVRGVAVKLMGVPGPKALGTADTHDLLFNQTPRAEARTPEEFVALVDAAAKGPLGLPFRLAGAIGWGRAFTILRGTLASHGAPFASFASESFWSMVPYRLGVGAARFSLVAVEPRPKAGPTLAADLVARLRGGAAWTLRVQLYQDATRTPIEDPTVEWDAPWIDVGQLRVAPVDVTTDRGRQVAAYVERLAFDPWHAVEAMRPLGAFNRLRKAVYFAASAQHRDTVPEGEVAPLP